ncbi:MAG TPA: DNA-binding response regulator [Chloroflexi bacterium]|nr:DNA-binding response regulator [Chloroflexota bacterium]
MSEIRVLLAEDHTIVRKGLRALLEDAKGIEVVDEAENGREAVDKSNQHRPDVVVMDISMPLLNGLEATRRIKEQDSNIKVIILTMHADEEYVLQGLRAGADGYLVKQTAPAELVAAVLAAFHGDSFLSPSISRTVIKEYIRGVESNTEFDSYETLTDREREVLQLVAEGLSVREIAEHLYISEKTARAHRSNLMNKLELHNIAALTIYALRKGVISLDE